MTWQTLSGLTVLIAWLAWALAGALALRLVLMAVIGRMLPRSLSAFAGLLVCASVASIFVGSVALHLAVLGPPNMYGATSQEAFSLVAYLLAPFGLPLLVGSVLLLPYDLANCLLRGLAR